MFCTPVIWITNDLTVLVLADLIALHNPLNRGLPVHDIFIRLPDTLLSQLGAVRQWLKDRWPNAKLPAEVPLSQLMGSRQVMSGPHRPAAET